MMDAGQLVADEIKFFGESEGWTSESGDDGITWLMRATNAAPNFAAGKAGIAIGIGVDSEGVARYYLGDESCTVSSLDEIETGDYRLAQVVRQSYRQAVIEMYDAAVAEYLAGVQSE